MILMRVEATKSQIWFSSPCKALHHPKSSSQKPRGPNCWEDLLQTKETELEEENDFDDSKRDKIIDMIWWSLQSSQSPQK